MRKLARWLGGAALALSLAEPASASLIVGVRVDPGQSSVTPAVGPAETLSGTITLGVGMLPVLATTTFDVIGLAITSSGGATIGLDPDVLNPGLGVIAPSGAFVIPTLFVRLVQGPVTIDLPIPDVTGSVLFGPLDDPLARVETSFSIATGGPAGDVLVHIVAVPEPGTLVLLGGGLLALVPPARRARPLRPATVAIRQEIAR